MHALKLGDQEYEKRSEDRFPFKVWKILTTDAQADLRQVDSAKIGLVKDNTVKTSKPWGGDIYSHHNNSQAKFLCINKLEDWKNDSVYMKEVDNFISGCDIPP